MEYQEAISILHPNTSKDAIWEIEANGKNGEKAVNEACIVACEAMDELQMYKDNRLCLIPDNVYKRQYEELDEYKKLGTLEEVRKAVEKQKKKKPYASNRCYVCPHCGLITNLRIKHNYCDACGQRLDWRNE